jgi:hypothetical protein
MQKFLVQAWRGKKTMVSPAVRRRRLQYRSHKSPRKEEESFPFGLSPVDYSKPPPIAPTLLPPPPRKGLQRLVSPAIMILFICFGGYLYFNSDKNTYEYWRQVETGGNLIDDEDDEED